MEMDDVEALGAQDVRGPRGEPGPGGDPRDRSAREHCDGATEPDHAFGEVISPQIGRGAPRVRNRGENVVHLRCHDSHVVAEPPGRTRKVMHVLLDAAQGRIVVLGDNSDLHGSRTDAGDSKVIPERAWPAAQAPRTLVAGLRAEESAADPASSLPSR